MFWVTLKRHHDHTHPQRKNKCLPTHWHKTTQRLSHAAFESMTEAGKRICCGKLAAHLYHAHGALKCSISGSVHAWVHRNKPAHSHAEPPCSTMSPQSSFVLFLCSGLMVWNSFWSSERRKYRSTRRGVNSTVLRWITL